jgi:transposase
MTSPNVNDEITREVLRFVLAHPDIVRGSSKNGRYSDTFKHFILDLYTQNNSLAISTFAMAVTIGPSTLQRWIQESPFQKEISSAKSEISSSHPISQSRQEPLDGKTSYLNWKRRPDHFASVWSEIHNQLQTAPKLSCQKLLDTLIKRYPGRFSAKQLRTLQRRVKRWRQQLTEIGPQEITANTDRCWFAEIVSGVRSCKMLQAELGPIPDLELLVMYATEAHLQQKSKALTILGRYKGLSDATISTILQFAPSTSRKYFDTYCRFGLTRLFGHPPNSTEATEIPWATKQLLELLHHKPLTFGITRTTWTLQSLANAFEKQHGITISLSSVSRYVKKAGYGWKKARRVLSSPDPNYREKVEMLLQTLHSLKPNEQFFFVDEMGPIAVKKYGGKCYVHKTDKPIYPQNQKRKGDVIIIAALNASANQMTWCYRDSKDTSAMIYLLELLFNEHFDKRRIYITWDAASWHDSNDLLAWLDDFNLGTRKAGTGPIVELVPLPSCSQFLNVIEAVFSAMKRAVIHNSDYQSTREMKTLISRHLSERNQHFKDNPQRAGKKIWELDFFLDYQSLISGNYRDY